MNVIWKNCRRAKLHSFMVRHGLKKKEKKKKKERKKERKKRIDEEKMKRENRRRPSHRIASAKISIR